MVWVEVAACGSEARLSMLQACQLLMDTHSACNMVKLVCQRAQLASFADL